MATHILGLIVILTALFIAEKEFLGADMTWWVALSPTILGAVFIFPGVLAAIFSITKEGKEARSAIKALWISLRS